MSEQPTAESTHDGSPAEPAGPLAVELKNVSKAFVDARTGERLSVLERIDLTVSNTGGGRLVVVLGPSGCGKSTLLKLISGLLPPDPGGEVLVNGRLLTESNALSATVPQAYTCFPWLTVLGNVEFGLTLRHVPKAEREAEALKYLTKVGLADRAAARPRQLSGGMQQRVAIARALVLKLPLVLMDEPFGALDAQTRAEMQDTLLMLWGEERNLIVFVTHDISEALLLADQVVVLRQRPVRLLETLEVPFPRPRRASDDSFVLCAEGLRHLLKLEVPDSEFRLCAEVLRLLLRPDMAREAFAHYGKYFRRALEPTTPPAHRQQYFLRLCERLAPAAPQEEPAQASETPAGT